MVHKSTALCHLLRHNVTVILVLCMARSELLILALLVTVLEYAMHKSVKERTDLLL